MSQAYPELDGLDYERIAACMRRKNWTWELHGKLPTAEEIEAVAQELVRDCRAEEEWHEQQGKKRGGPRFKSTATGGLQVVLYEDGSSAVNFGWGSYTLIELRKPARATEAGAELEGRDA